MNTLQIKNITFNKGIPKVCIPIMPATLAEAIHLLPSLHASTFDVLEVRMDYFNESITTLLETLQNALPDCVLLATFRSAKEGGEKEISEEDYMHLLIEICERKLADIIDIEYMSGKDVLNTVIACAKDNGLKTLISYHNFQRTMSKEGIVNRFEQMENFDADILKIAMMPRSPEDILNLILATRDMSENTEKVLVSMSMGEFGQITRIIGEHFHSAMTFASHEKESAPGQIPLPLLQDALQAIHKIHKANKSEMTKN